MKLKSLDELARLLPASATTPRVPDKSGHDGKGQEVRILVDRKGRKGKTVTLVAGLRHNPDTMEKIARILKERCATGGTVKEGKIELQGDQRARAKAELERLNYIVR